MQRLYSPRSGALRSSDLSSVLGLSCVDRACLRLGNYFTKTASRLLEAEGAGHDAHAAGGAPPRFPNAAVIYANTDSLFVRLPGRSVAQAVSEGKAMAHYVSSHASMPPALNLEFERVLSPCLLDAHNKYAGAEYTVGDEGVGTLHQKGLIERRQCAFVQTTIRGALERLLVEGDEGAAVEYCARMGSELLGGEVASHLVRTRKGLESPRSESRCTM